MHEAQVYKGKSVNRAGLFPAVRNPRYDMLPHPHHKAPAASLS
jgi:hypothetical protein